MSASNKEYRKILNKLFIVHVGMFFVAFTAAIFGQSSSVLADSFDFIGDAIGYALGIYVMNKAIMFRAAVSVIKGITMLTFGIPVMAYAFMRFLDGTPPNYEIMTMSGICGIIAHLYCVNLLYNHRTGDSNRLSIWICTINDLISNVITVVASILVLKFNSLIPDLIGAGIIVIIAMFGAIVILRAAYKEIKSIRYDSSSESQGINT